MTRISALVVRVPVPRAVWTLTNRHFVASQNTDGGWAYRRRGEKSYGSTTAFCLLFLAKGNRPVLIQKLQHSADWNRNINDFEHLTAFIGETLGKRTTWQSASLDLSLEQLRQSPILFIAGHKFPTFTDAQKAKLQAYVDRAGGTLLLEACCGSDDFKAGFRKLAAQLWPDYPLAALRGDHPVFSSVYDLDTTYD
ncbi:MAG: DUF4159 domain-containing protein, partial [Phycisphaerae bacterium]|nr:DUF4159 domain-containing protein [Phycisphaerae bacterium]